MPGWMGPWTSSSSGSRPCAGEGVAFKVPSKPNHSTVHFPAEMGDTPQDHPPHLPPPRAPEASLTVFAVVEDLQLALLRAQQRLRQLRNGALGGVGAGEEVAGAGPLHHLDTRVTKHLTEAVVAVDDGTVLHLSVGDQELAVCGDTGERGAEVCGAQGLGYPICGWDFGVYLLCGTPGLVLGSPVIPHSLLCEKIPLISYKMETVETRRGRSLLKCQTAQP